MRGTSEGGDGALVSGSYFSVLGLTPHLGRLLGPEDDRQPGSGQVVVLSYDYWQRRFGARSDAIGQLVRVNGYPMTIVGVAPQGFHGTTFGERPRIYVPITMREYVVPHWKGLDDRRSYWAYLFARLKPGVSTDQAAAIFNGQYRSIHHGSRCAAPAGHEPVKLGAHQKHADAAPARRAGAEPRT